MEHEFIDEMLERLLVNERMPVYDAFEKVIKERAKIIQDLGRIENAYQLFRKRHNVFPGDSFCLYRGKWMLSTFVCSGYKPNFRARWQKFVSFVKNGR